MQFFTTTITPLSEYISFIALIILEHDGEQKISPHITHVSIPSIERIPHGQVHDHFHPHILILLGLSQELIYHK